MMAYVDPPLAMNIEEGKIKVDKFDGTDNFGR